MLTCTDINLLNRIVLRASRDPSIESTPFRALFSAYDAVFRENGIDSNQDQVCLRFIFRLGNRGLPGQELYAEFEKLLLRMGIRLVFDREADAASTRSDEVIALEDEENGLNGLLGAKTRARRASFDETELDGVEDETTRKGISRVSSRASLSRIEVGKSSFLNGSAKKSAAPSRKEMRALHDWQSPAQAPRDRLSGNDISKDLGPYQRRRSQSSHSSRISILADADRFLFSDQRPESGQQAATLLYHPQDRRIFDLAETFDDVRLLNFCGRVYRRWRRNTLEAAGHHKRMEATAVYRDSETLLRQSFEIWHVALQQKRQEDETERFFQNLERRAGKARDLYLKTKALTHWLELTAERTQGTAIARRHILRVRYFHAWKKLTTTSQLTMRQWRLDSTFHQWRRRYLKVLDDGVAAAEVSDSSVAHRVFNRWFYAHLVHKARQWMCLRLKVGALATLVRHLRDRKQSVWDIETQNERHLVQKHFGVWVVRLRNIHSIERQAQRSKKQKLLQQSFQVWRKETQLAPLCRHISNMIDWRVARAFFRTWASRTRIALEAIEKNKLRIIRNAWDAWNDLLRIKQFTVHINEKFVQQTLYKWVLMERYQLMKRLSEDRLKRSAFNSLLIVQREGDHELPREESRLLNFRNSRACSRALDCWTFQLSLQRQREQVASEFHSPRVIQEKYLVWISQKKHVRQLQAWAASAEQYFLATRCVRRWHEAVDEARKQRRRDSYAHMRRLVKVNLVHGLLQQWHSKAQHIRRLGQQASTRCQTGLILSAIQYYDKWQKLTIGRGSLSFEAGSYHRQRLLSTILQFWLETHLTHLQWAELASHNDAMHIAAIAVIALRKMSLRVFEIKSRHETAAEGMRIRNYRKHLRSLFRVWLDRTSISQARSHDSVEARPTPTPRRTMRFTGQHALGRRGSHNDADDEGLPPMPGHADPVYANLVNHNTTDGQDQNKNNNDSDISEDDDLPSLPPSPSTYVAPTTPMPGYLSTPSKRAARARALVDRSAVTPRTPMNMTPFAQRSKMRIGVWSERSVSAGKEGRERRENRLILRSRSGSAAEVARGFDEIGGLGRVSEGIESEENSGTQNRKR